MRRIFRKTGALAPFVMISMLGHLLGGYILEAAGPLDFSPPLSPIPALHVTLSGPRPAPPRFPAEEREIAAIPPLRPAGHDVGAQLNETAPALSQPESLPSQDSVRENSKPAEIAADPFVLAEGKAIEPPATVIATAAANVTIPIAVDYERYRGPVRTASEFMTARRERLTYRISLVKIPLGRAVMEASNVNGDFRITLRITSGGMLSSLYPVDDLVETRMIGGNYLLTRVRQNEGDLHGDFGFTLMLRERKAFWVDRLRNRYDYQPLPDADVTDALAGFYLLRNRELEVGGQVLLNIFDGSEHSPVRVQVLRRDRVRLADLRNADTIVIRPELPAVGLFRNNRDMLVWLTDDENSVPVKLECATPVGRVTAELVSSEVDPLPPPL